MFWNKDISPVSMVGQFEQMGLKILLVISSQEMQDGKHAEGQLGVGFKHFFMFTLTWGNDPI